MDRHIAPDVPLVAVYNNLEVAFDFLNRSHDDEVVRRRYSRGDRALLWLGDPKLAFVTMPVPHTDYVRERLGYANTEVVAPLAPSAALSLDILAEPRLLERLLEYAGTGAHRTTGALCHDAGIPALGRQLASRSWAECASARKPVLGLPLGA